MPVQKVAKKPAASPMTVAKTNKRKKNNQDCDQIISEKDIQNDMIIVLHGEPLGDLLSVPFLQHSIHCSWYPSHFYNTIV